MTSNIHRASELFQLQSTCEPIVKIYADHPYYGDLHTGYTKIYRALKDANINANDVGFLTTLRYLRYRVHFVPLAFFQHKSLFDDFENQSEHAQEIYPFITHELRVIREQLIPAFRESTDNPLMSCLHEVCEKSGSVQLMLFRSAQAQDVYQTITNDGYEGRITLIRESEYFSGDTINHLVTIGPLTKFPPAVFRSRRSHKLSVVSVRGSSGAIPRRVVLSDFPTLENEIKTRQENEVEINSEITYEDEIPSLIDWSVISKEVSLEEGQEFDNYNHLNATVLLFTDNLYTFVDANPDESIQSLDIRLLHSNSDDFLYLLQRRDMKVGSYVLIRTDDTADYVDVVADRLLGASAGYLRKQLLAWKTKLGNLIQVDGLELVIKQLKDAGATDTVDNQFNVVRWANLETIRPQKDQNLIAILRVVGYPAYDIPRLVNDTQKIANAHIQAGQRVRKMLRDSITQKGMKDMTQELRIDFVLRDIGATLTAFEILEIGDKEVKVPRSHLRKLYSLIKE